MANRNPGGRTAPLYLEDLRVGQRFVSGTHRLDEEQIRAFAGQFDPQPFHLDAEAAKATLFEGLVASGWHTAAITMRLYAAVPYTFEAGGQTFTVRYVPADMDTADFGGNSNWRGPVWMPVNCLLIEALRKYHRFYGDSFTVECPTGSGNRVTLDGIADELGRRLASLFLPMAGRPRPCHGSFGRFADSPHWRDHVLFFEYFDGDTGWGLGASHQTGWTALVATLIEQCARPTARPQIS